MKQATPEQERLNAALAEYQQTILNLQGRIAETAMGAMALKQENDALRAENAELQKQLEVVLMAGSPKAESNVASH